MTKDEIISVLFPSRELIEKIVQYPGPYTDEEEQNECKRIIESLTEEEVLIAARISYAYWVKENFYNDDEKIDIDLTIQSAMKEARRHYVGQSKNFDVALNNIKNTLAWRKEKKIDLLRLVFLGNEKEEIIHKILDNGTISDEDIEIINRYRRYVEEDTLTQNIAVRGHDKSKRGIAIKFERTAPLASEEEEELEKFKISQLFLTEKVIAVTEIVSEGVEEKVIATYDFNNYSVWNKPPSYLIRDTLGTLQEHFPERAFRLIITDPPFWLRSILSLLSTVIPAVVFEKLLYVTGDDYKRQIISEYIDVEQAMPFMLPEGNLTTPVDIARVVNQPFHHLYDDENVEWEQVK